MQTCQRNVAKNRNHIHSAFPFLLVITIFDQKSNEAYWPTLGTDTLSTGISRISIIIKIYGIMEAHYRSSLSWFMPPPPPPVLWALHRGVLDVMDNPALISGLVYHYKCDACSATYIGQTKKCLKTRVGEHFGVSPRTASLLVRPPQSTIRDHIEICGSSKSVDNFRCLNTFSNSILLRINESLEISTRKPELNLDGSSYSLLL